MCELVVDCPHFTPKWTTEGFVVIRNQNIRNGRLDLSNTSFTYKEDFERRITRAKPQEGDIIFTREAPMGEVCAIPEGLECCLGQRQVLLRPKVDIDGKYLLFALQSPYVRHQIFWNEGTGSTVSNVRIPVLKALKIPRQPNEKAIAHILGTLDDKIELNRRTNETLEAMAKAIFKDWFVDFGPTRAKMEGRAPYLPEELWSLFPGAIDDETGLPQGWEEKSLDEIADFLNGLALQKYPPSDNEASLPVIKIAELRSGITEKSGRASRQIQEKYIVQDGDFLFSWSGSLVAKFWTEGEGALNQHLFKVTSANYPTWFYTQWVYEHLAAFQHIAASKATTMGHIQRGHLTAAKVICPQSDLMNPMSDLINPIVEKTIGNRLESRTLTELRDRLLPKLMSGEIRVRDAEKAAEEVI